MLKKIFFLVIFCAFFGSIFSQEKSLLQRENELKILFETLKDNISDSLKVAVNEQITNDLQEALSLPDAFAYPFDNLNYLGKVRATDGQIRIFTWNFETCGGWHFSGLVHQKNGKILPFLSPKTYEPAENTKISFTNWYGALYYEVIATKIGRQTVYTLLGWQKSVKNYQTKIVDILVLENEPYFGEKMIEKDENNIVCRRLFQYDNQVVMNLFYDVKSRRILFDHLSPIYAGELMEETTFGPDMSIDCLQFKSKKWRLKEDVKVKNE